MLEIDDDEEDDGEGSLNPETSDALIEKLKSKQVEKRKRSNAKAVECLDFDGTVIATYRSTYAKIPVNF